MVGSRPKLALTLSALLGTLVLSACATADHLSVTPPPESWFTYQNRWYAYEIRFPPDSSLVETIGGTSTVIYLHTGAEPFSASDHLVLLSAGRGTCEALGGTTHPAYTARGVTVGEADFLWRQGSAGATRWESYSMEREGVCLTITYSARTPEVDRGITPRAPASQLEEQSILQGMLISLRWSVAE